MQNQSGKIWRCTRVYGHAEARQNHHTWTLLKRLAELYSYSWCCFGDFNEILDFHEKSRGHERSVNMVADFRETIKACDSMIWVIKDTNTRGQIGDLEATISKKG